MDHATRLHNMKTLLRFGIDVHISEFTTISDDELATMMVLLPKLGEHSLYLTAAYAYLCAQADPWQVTDQYLTRTYGISIAASHSARRLCDECVNSWNVDISKASLGLLKAILRRELTHYIRNIKLEDDPQRYYTMEPPKRKRSKKSRGCRGRGGKPLYPAYPQPRPHRVIGEIGADGYVSR